MVEILGIEPNQAIKERPCGAGPPKPTAFPALYRGVCARHGT